MTTPNIDKSHLLDAVGAELAGHRPHHAFEDVHAATETAIEAAFGNPYAHEVVDGVAAQDPNMADLVGTASELAQRHPGFWVGVYAHEHHAAPLPADHPWSHFIARTFGRSDAPAHPWHGGHRVGYFGHGPGTYWHPGEQRFIHPPATDAYYQHHYPGHHEEPSRYATPQGPQGYAPQYPETYAPPAQPPRSSPNCRPVWRCRAPSIDRWPATPRCRSG